MRSTIVPRWVLVTLAAAALILAGCGGEKKTEETAQAAGEETAGRMQETQGGHAAGEGMHGEGGQMPGEGEEGAEGMEAMHGEGGGEHVFPMPEMTAFHDYLRPIVHEYLPEKKLDELREAADSLMERSQTLMQAKMPAVEGIDEATVRDGFHELGVRCSLLKQAADAGDWEEIEAAVNSVHDQFETMMEVVGAK